MSSARTFGFELEYATGVNMVLDRLRGTPWIGDASRHDYHCRCETCDYTGEFGDPWPLRAQRDSTADGEFITKILDDWDEARGIIHALTEAADDVASVGPRCGLHVHVDGRTPWSLPTDDPDAVRRHTPGAYLAFERYFTEIVAPGASIRKRDMNSTLMQAARQYVSDSYQPRRDAWLDMGRGEVDALLLQAIGRDRHVDLNYNQRHHTWEFRAFNATNSPWRIELACRMAVAFVAAVPQLRDEVETQVRGSKFWPEGCDSPWGEIIRPAFSELPAPHPTKKPVVPMARFVDILCDVDPDLRPLIEKQANYMRARFAKTVECAA